MIVDGNVVDLCLCGWWCVDGVFCWLILIVFWVLVGFLDWFCCCGVVLCCCVVECFV